MSKKYFGTDGIRGKFGVEPLIENFFVLLGAAISKSLLKPNDCKKRILFGCDTRESSNKIVNFCLLYTSPSPRDGLLSRMPSSA